MKWLTGAASAVSAVALVLGLDIPHLPEIEQGAVYGHVVLLGLSLAGSAVILSRVALCAYRNRTRIRAYWTRMMREYEAGRR
jgi:hypothetical protein